jgi:hypothetical protein
MAKTNTSDIRAALGAIAAADNGAGGVVTLTGKSNPLVEWGDHGMNDRPISTWAWTGSRIRQGTKDGFVHGVQIDVWAEANSTGIEDTIADRWEELLIDTSTAWINQGLDVGCYLRSRRPIPELDEGRRRSMLEFDLWFNR